MGGWVIAGPRVRQLAAHRQSQLNSAPRLALPPRPPTQTAGPIWNLRGVNCNSWHRVKVEVKP